MAYQGMDRISNLNRLRMYKTAYSPMHEKYVGILNVFLDTDGKPIIKGHLAGEAKDDYILFRENELTAYCL